MTTTDTDRDEAKERDDLFVRWGQSRWSLMPESALRRMIEVKETGYLDWCDGFAIGANWSTSDPAPADLERLAKEMELCSTMLSEEFGKWRCDCDTDQLDNMIGAAIRLMPQAAAALRGQGGK